MRTTDFWSDTLRSDIAQVIEALASNAEAVCRRYLQGGAKKGRYWICGDKQGGPGKSMWVRLGPPGTVGKWTDEATGEHGDLLDIVQANMQHRATHALALDEARSFLSITPPAPKPKPVGYETRIRVARDIWGRARRLPGSPAAAYLTARGIRQHHWDALRFAPDALLPGGVRAPAMIAAAVTASGQITAIQRTFLDDTEPRKRAMDAPRRSLGSMRGAFVPLGRRRPDCALVVAEGVESALSALLLHPEASAAVATLSAGNMKSFTPPALCGEVLIASDADEPSIQAATVLLARCRHLGRAARVLTPSAGDWNDELLARGPERLP